MNYIGYYRVSTDDQGKSGLGLAAQQDSVRSFCQSNGTLVGEFTDIESGKVDERVGLQNAISLCVKSGATLVVKDLSRISRGGFKIMTQLEELGVNYIESASPFDTQLVKEFKFSLAKDERKKISDRTSAALTTIKRKLEDGIVHISKAGNVVTSLGNPQNLTDEARKAGRDAYSKKAYDKSLQAGKFAVALSEAGKNGQQITDALNDTGFTTPRGGSFSRTQTLRLLQRYGSSE